MMMTEEPALVQNIAQSDENQAADSVKRDRDDFKETAQEVDAAASTVACSSGKAAEASSEGTSRSANDSASALAPTPPPGSRWEDSPSPKDTSGTGTGGEDDDEVCAICMGKMENKSFTNSCFHQFCFTCLLEWSKVKAECPLCKQKFKSIVHNVRSMEDYDQYHIRVQPYEERRTRSRHHHHPLVRLNPWEYEDEDDHPYSRTTYSRARLRHQLYQGLTSTTQFRQLVYSGNIWVRQSELFSHRYRECSPEFYEQNPACTHRLIPWLNREFNALMCGHQGAYLIELVLSLLTRYSIRSREFEEHLRPYLARRTEHFLHEFYQFARSPHGMVEYDQHADYRGAPGPPTNVSTRSMCRRREAAAAAASANVATSSNVEEVIVVSPPHRPASSSRPPWSRRTTAATAAANERIAALAQKAREFLECITVSESSSTAEGRNSPQPGPSGCGRTTASFVLSSFTIHDISSDSNDEGSVHGLSLPFPEHLKQEVPPSPPQPADDDDDDCVIIAVGKKSNELLPEVILLSDDSDLDFAAAAATPPLPPHPTNESPKGKATSRSSSSSSVTSANDEETTARKRRKHKRRSASRESSHRRHRHHRHHSHKKKKSHSKEGSAANSATTSKKSRSHRHKKDH